MKKIKKLIKSPGVFFRDHFDNKYPLLLNEIKCPKHKENILLEHNLILEKEEVVNFPIDVVFTWVNDNDLKWKEKFHYFKNCESINHGRFALDKARFSNHEELKFSIESVLKNIPWVRNIFIVTDNQHPSWLKNRECFNKKIIIVDHKEIIKKEYLPTFNSHVIEAHLHLINGLSENFIYFNDDVFVARPLPPGHFFKANGLTSLFISNKSIKGMLARGVETPTLTASLIGSSLLQHDFNVIVDRPLVHTYIPLKKRYFSLAWEKYEYQINQFLHSRFRGKNDLNLASFLVPWLMYLEGDACFQTDICYYFNIRSTAARRFYSELLKGQQTGLLPHSFCANDFNTEGNEMISYSKRLESFLTSFFI